MMLETRGVIGPVVGLTARFRAPRKQVFAAWTGPELIRKWFFAEAGYQTHEVQVSLAPLGPYQVVIAPSDGGEPTRIHGHFVEVESERSLVYTWTGACADEQYWTLVNVAFEDDGEGCQLTLQHGVFRTDADRAMHEQGWLACMTSLERLLSTD